MRRLLPVLAWWVAVGAGVAWIEVRTPEAVAPQPAPPLGELLPGAEAWPRSPDPEADRLIRLAWTAPRQESVVALTEALEGPMGHVAALELARLGATEATAVVRATADRLAGSPEGLAAEHAARLLEGTAWAGEPGRW